MNISSDLTFNNNNSINVRSERFQVQSAVLSGAADLGCIYVNGADLYYRDVNGNNVQITSAGSVNATTSGISSGTATASFVAGVLVVNAASNTPANIQAASILIGNNLLNSNYVTVSPPAALGASYGLTLPPLPASQKIMTLDASGVMSAPYVVDNSTIVISSNTLSVSSAGIGSGLADGISILNTAGVLSVKNTEFTYEFKLNGNYQSLSGSSLLQLDGLCFFNYNVTIVNVYAWIKTAGSSGTTTLDLKLATAPGGSYTTIFTTKPAFTTTAAAGSYVDSTGVVTPGTGVTAGVLSVTSINAGSALKFDLTGVMTGSATDSCGMTVIFKQR
jgi:hypothetical protein